MEVLALLQQVGSDEDERVARHAELADERLIHLARHTAHRLLPTQEAAEYLRRLGERLSPGLRLVDVKEQVEVIRYVRQFVERAPAAPYARGGTVSIKCSKGFLTDHRSGIV